MQANKTWKKSVLNLVINGIPSILITGVALASEVKSFKPYYKWNTFNTIVSNKYLKTLVLMSFKPYYKWNTFNTAQD